MRALSRMLAVVALLGVGYFLGQLRSETLVAQPTPNTGNKRVVAYIYGSTPITREEFGEHLISLYGKEHIRLYVNRRIIEGAATKKGLTVTPQEVEAVIADDCGKMGVTQKQFVETVLKQKYGKTIDEWRSDVIRPRLLMGAMCREQIRLDDAELKKVYDNLYGEKVQCKIILWPPDQKQAAFKRYASIRASETEFDDAARSQLSSDLSARCGLVDPIGRNAGPGTAKIEEIAFSLKEGQLSELLDTPGGIMVIKCVKKIPARTDVTFEAVKTQLAKECTERQMELEIPKAFNKLYDEASPLFILAPGDLTAKEQEEQSKRILGTDPAKVLPTMK